MMIELLKKGSGIHIKKENRGKFRDYCGGKVTSECIARGKNSPDPKIRKRATFAANVRKFKHLWGGTLEDTRSDTTRLGGWLKTTLDNISKGFWDFGDATGLYDKEGFNHMMSDLEDFGLISTSDGDSLAIVAPAITNSVILKIPLVEPSKAFLVIPTKWSIKPAFNRLFSNTKVNAAGQQAAADIATEYNLTTPKFGRGRPSYKMELDGKTIDIRYPEPTVTLPKILRNTKQAYQRRRIEDKKDNIRLRGGLLTTFKGDAALSLDDMRAVNQGRPRTKATRETLRGLLEGSYKDSRFGRLWRKVTIAEAKKGYETPTMKLNRLLILRDFAEAYGYYFK